ncbi:MAG: TonB-dependent receptor [Methylococcales bacterium]|jgi:iron complex outermembrane receptor protein|nr:TonB-dependent receptor [Methylococcales bacterium]
MVNNLFHTTHKAVGSRKKITSLELLKQSALITPLLIGNAYASPEQTYKFNLPAQPLSATLNSLAQSSHTKLVYTDTSVKGLSAAPVKGQYTAQQALNIALGKSGLNYKVVDKTLITVSGKSSKPTETTLKAMTVVGAQDPNDPYNQTYTVVDSSTATKTDTPLMLTPMSVKVVTQQVIKDQQVITVDQALRNVSGAVPGAGGTGNFFLRGFGNSNIYRDGFLNQSQWAHTEDLANVERVEVLKGPGSVLYGRTEPGGLVNFVTKKPLDTAYYSLSQQFGSFDLYRTSVDATGPLTANKDLAYRFNLGYQTNNTFQQFGGNERLLVAPSLRWNISDKTTSTIQVTYSDIKETGNGTVPLMGNRPAPIPRSENLGDPWNLQEDEYTMVSLNTEHNFNKDWKLQHRFNFSNHTLTMSAINPDGNWAPVAPNGNITRSFFAQNTDGHDYQHNFFNALELTGKFNTGFAKHTTLMGGDYYRSDYRSTMAGFGANPNQYDTTNIYHPTHMAGPPTITSADVTTGNFSLPWFGLYAQDQIELPFHINLLGGFRYDNAETSGSSTGEYGGPVQSSSYDKVSPRGGLVWQPIPELSLYGSYTENFGAANNYGANTQPLPPQTGQQWETGIKTELFDGKFNATLAYYDLKKQNVPVQVAPLITQAIGEAETRGLELDVSGQILPGWNIIGGYSYMPFAKTLKDSVGAGTEGMRLDNAPINNGNLWTTYEFQHQAIQGVKVGGGVQAIGQREIGYNNSAQAPGYVTVNLMASKLWKVGKSRLTTQINLDNLIDKNYYSSVYSYGPSNYGAPRTVMGSIKIEY